MTHIQTQALRCLATLFLLTSCNAAPTPAPAIETERPKPATQTPATQVMQESQPTEVATLSPAPASAPQTAGEPVVISFAHSKYYEPYVRPLIAEFEQQHPNISIDFVPIEDLIDNSFWSKPVPSGASDHVDAHMRIIAEAADTRVVDYFGARAEIERSLLPLDSLARSRSEFAWEKFLPAATARATYKDKLYLLPTSIRPKLLVYDAGQWGEAGVPPPNPQSTWQDHLESADLLVSKLGKDNEEFYGLTVMEESGFVLGQLQSSNKDYRTIIESEDFFKKQEIVDLVDQFRQAGRSKRIFANIDNVVDSKQRLIQNRDVGLWDYDIETLVFADAVIPLVKNRQLIPWPKSDQDDPGLAGLAISKGTQHPLESFTWISWLSQHTAANGLTSATTTSPDYGKIPALASQLDSAQLWTKMTAEAAAELKRRLKPVEVIQTFAADNKVGLRQFALRIVLQEVLSGQDTVSALASGESAYRAMLAQPRPASVDKPFQVATRNIGGNPQLGTGTVLTFTSVTPDPAVTARLRELAENYNASQPNLVVRVVEGDASRTQGEIAQSTDCFYSSSELDHRTVDDLVAIEPLLRAESTDIQTDIPNQFWYPFTQDGVVYGLPLTIGMRTLVVDLDLLRQHEVAPPSPTPSFEDLSRVAAEIFKKSNGEIFGFASPRNQSADMLYLLSGMTSTASISPLLLNDVDNPDLADATQRYVDFALTTPHSGLPLVIREISEPKTVEALKSKRVAMWFDASNTPLFSTDGRNVSVQLMPFASSMLLGSQENSGGMYISAKSELSSECIKWMLFVSQDGKVVGRSFPARKSVAISTDYTGTVSDAKVAADFVEYLSKLESTQSAEPLEVFTPKLYWYFQAVNSAFQEKSLLAPELAKVSQQIRGYSSCVANGDAPLTCAVQIDKDYEGIYRQ
jgi:ABC-type glycerol-3-phosphate transport system substrate-binding protein